MKKARIHQIRDLLVKEANKAMINNINHQKTSNPRAMMEVAPGNTLLETTIHHPISLIVIQVLYCRF